MKRYGNIFEKIIDIDNIKLAHRKARRDKSHYVEVKMVDKDIDHHAREIQKILIDESYEVSEYKFSIINDKGKERKLMKLPYYPDRIIQWAIMLQIEDIFIRKFINQTCASIPKRGIHRAYGFMQKYLRDKEASKYCLKMDVRHFYENIDKMILKNQLDNTFKDEKLLRLLYKIVDSYPEEAGVPIGSYLSQYFGNFYLNDLDHYIKEDLHCKRYVRYMDDMVILGSDKEELHEIRRSVEKYLNDKLKLELKDNYQVFPTRVRGVDFVGYRFFDDYTLLRKSTCKKFKRRMNRIRKKDDISYSDFCSINSYKGWLLYCNSYRLSQKYLGGLDDKIKKCDWV